VWGIGIISLGTTCTIYGLVGVLISLTSGEKTSSASSEPLHDSDSSPSMLDFLSLSVTDF
jgi:hypothetical protein